MEENASAEKKALFCCVLYVITHKKDPTIKEGSELKKNPVPGGRCLFSHCFKQWVAGVSSQTAHIREPLVLGRMLVCQLHGGKEQWLFNLLFIAKPIWGEWRQEDLRRASFPWGLAHLLRERRVGCTQEATALSIVFARMLAHVATEQMTGSERREVS